MTRNVQALVELLNVKNGYARRYASAEIAKYWFYLDGELLEELKKSIESSKDARMAVNTLVTIQHKEKGAHIREYRALNALISCLGSRNKHVRTEVLLGMEKFSNSAVLEKVPNIMDTLTKASNDEYKYAADVAKRILDSLKKQAKFRAEEKDQ